MQRINMIKYGFVRSPEDDFNDDGSHFTCYRVGNVRVSKTVYDGIVYLLGSLEGQGFNLPYEVYSKLPHYNQLDELNGIPVSALTDAKLAKLYNDCIAYEQEYNETLRNYQWPSINQIEDVASQVRAHYEEQKETLKRLICVDPTKLFKLSDYDLRQLKYYYQRVEEKANSFKAEEYAKSIFKTASSIKFVEYKQDLKEEWYYNQCLEYLRKCELAV